MAGEAELQSGGVPAPAPAAAPSAPVSSPGLEGQITTAAGPAGGVPAAPGAPAPGPAEWQGIRDFARAQGQELPWDDDAVALGHLLQAYRKSQQPDFYSQVGRKIAPHLEQFQAFLKQQQTPLAAAAPPAWQAPPFKREWLSLVETDPDTGQMRAKAGYDPAIVEKVQAYADWRDKFLQEPEQMLGPMVEQRAQAIVQQQLASYREQQEASTLVSREAAWMFQGGSVGGPLTAAGQMYQRAAGQLWDSGLRNVQHLHAAAVSMVQNAFLRQQVAKRQADASGVPTPAQQGAAPVSVAQALARPGLPAPAPPAQMNRPAPTMRELMMSRLTGIPESSGVS